MPDNSEILSDSGEILIDDAAVAPDGDTEPKDLYDVLDAEGNPEEYWAGNETHPFLIKSLSDLRIMQEYYSDEGNKKYQWRNNQLQHFKLMTDITVTYESDEDFWEPIRGNKALCFDGNHHTISNVFIDIWNDNYNDNKTKIMKINPAYETWEDADLIPAFIMYADEIRDLTLLSVSVSYMCIYNIPQGTVWKMGLLAGDCNKCLNCTVGDGEGVIGFDISETTMKTAHAGGICYRAGQMENCRMKDEIWTSGWFTEVCGLACKGTSFINCGLEGSITACASSSVAGIAGSAATIDRCYTSEGIIINNIDTSEKNTTGCGACGICSEISYTYTDDGSCENCVNNADIEADGGPAAGIALTYTSYANTKSLHMAHCINKGKIKGRSAAGVIYNMGGTISQCANYGDLEITNTTNRTASAGVVGSAHQAVPLVINDCFNAGNITIKTGTNMTFGGILGWDKSKNGSTRKDGLNLEVKNCYNVGKFVNKGSDNTIGSFIGEISGSSGDTTINGNHYLTGTASSAIGKGGKSDYKVSKHSDADMKKASTYTGWDFDEVWTMGTGDYKYPVFAYGNSKKHTITLNANGGTIEGKDSIEAETNNLGILRSAPHPVNGDARFAGWYTEAAGGERVTQEYSFVEDTTIYAHWGTYDPDKRVPLVPIAPQNGEVGFTVKSDSWVSFELSFSTGSEIMGFDLLSGGLHIIDYESGESVYDLHSTYDLSYKNTDEKTIVYLNVYGIGMDYKTQYSITVDEGFLIFKDGSLYAFTENKDEWSFRSGAKMDKHRIRILNEAAGDGYDGILNYDFEYSDSFFYSPANEYNQKRTIWAMGLTMAGFESANGKTFDNYADGAKNARDMLRQFGFTCYEGTGKNGDPSSANEYYKKKPGENSFGVFTAHKEITDYDGNNYTLIAVTTRGAGYEKEWVSNFQIGHGLYHEGFKNASDKVLKQLADYIENTGISGNLKFVMGGYSRAGATTNISAARIDDGELTDMLSARGISVSIQRKDVYAYCFEPPATVSTDEDTETMYQNITNIINPSDLVPMVPLSGEGWNYKRYGTDYYLPNEAINSDDYSDLKKRFIGRYASFGLNYDDTPFQYVGEVSLSLDSRGFFSLPEMNMNIRTISIPQYSFLQMLTEDLRNTIPTSDLFLQRLQYDICNIVRKAFEGLNAKKVKKLLIEELMKQLYDVLIEEQLITADSRLVCDLRSAAFNIGSYKFGRIFQEHEPLVNFAWLVSIKGESDLLRRNTAALSVMQFFMDVDPDPQAAFAPSGSDSEESIPLDMTADGSQTQICVYNSSDELVAKLIGKTTVDVPGSEIAAYADRNGQLTLMLPKDDDFRIEITCAGNGTMDFSATGYSIAAMNYTDKKDYYDVALSKGEVLEAEVSSDGSVVLKNTSQETIAPSATFDETTLTRHDIQAEVAGDGSVAGTGCEMLGNHVMLTAIPDPGAEFEGWYDTETSDEPLSTEQNYNFRVERDRTLYAKFSEVADDVFAVDIPDQTYTGSVIKPEVAVYDHRTKLVKGKDYTVSYKNNKNAYTIGEEEQGFNKKKAPQAIIKMKGNYTGKKTIYFKILPMELSSGSFSASDLSVQYNGKKQTPSPILTRSGKKLKLNTDYVVEEYQAAKNDKTAFKGAVDEDTVYTLTLTGKKNYTGSRKITLTILGKAAEGEDGEVTQVMMNSVKVPSIPAQTYRIDEEGRADITVDNILDKKGKPLPFTVTWQKSKKEKYTFTQNVDYKVTYRKNSEIGIASIILTGLGNKQNENGVALVGTKTVSFKITGKNLKGAKVTGLASTYPYTGEEVIPTGYKVTLSGKELKAGDDYRVTFSKNVNAGTAAMTIIGTGAYTGKVKKTFKIGKASIGERGSKSDSVTVNNGEEITAVYKKSGTKPVITLKWLNGEGEEDDMILTEGVDFKVKYQNTSNFSATAPASKLPTATITGTGSFTGSFKVPLTITPADFSGLKDHAFAVDKAYSTKEGAYRSDVTIKDGDGKILKKDNDYEITEYELVGTCEQETGFINEYFENPEILDANSIPAPGNVIRATVKAKGCYLTADPEHPEKDSFFVEYRILPNGKDISKATVTLKGSKAFRGRAVKLTAEDFRSVKLGTEELVYGEDFEIDESSYVNCDKKGTAKVDIIGKGEYGGRKTLTFKIGTRSLSQTIWKAFRSLLG
ncbi:MAG: InlB B-repeat-containing protein [Lachnospiraceae bacterium]|nr:InlB B-repeat-containing protein [Lachnospiraceae bacterium]